MADRVYVEIKGGEELARKLKALGVDVEAVLDQAVKAGAELLAEEARRRAPGPHIQADKFESKKGYVVYDIGPDEEHWFYRFFETGATEHEIIGGPLVFEGAQGIVVTGGVQHPGVVAKPFLRPAIDEQGGKAVDRVGDELRKAVEKNVE